MSHIDGYGLSYDQIEQQTGMGRWAINEAAKVLETLGWLVVERPKNEFGQWANKTWTILDPSTVGNSTMETPHMGKPTDIRRTSLKENHVKELKTYAQNEFDKFWNVYPRKSGKQEALKAFDKAVGLFGFDVVLAGAIRFAHDPNLPSKEFIPYPATWLNRGCWDDEPLPERVKSVEETRLLEVELSRQKLATDRELTKRLLSEESKVSSPPPECVHGKAITKCRACLLRIN